MAFRSLQQLFLFSLLLLASIAAQVILARDLHSHISSPFLFPKHLQGRRKGDNIEGIRDIKIYLQHFGYLSNVVENDDAFDDLLESAIKAYQKNFNLNVSGVLDVETIFQMSQPRCGVPDFFNNGTTGMRSGDGHLHMGSHYVFLPGKPKWPISNHHLTYTFVHNYPYNFIAPVIRALAKWASISQFTFSQALNSETADIKISFERRDHGDGSPFDGRGGILAHAFAPTDGRLHFDGDETWTVGAVFNEFDVETVALHELGHVLGLGHSKIKAAIMWPYIDPGATKGLNGDDIAGIHALYS